MRNLGPKLKPTAMVLGLLEVYSHLKRLSVEFWADFLYTRKCWLTRQQDKKKVDFDARVRFYNIFTRVKELFLNNFQKKFMKIIKNLLDA